MSFSDIANSNPVNKTARLVSEESKDNWEWENKGQNIESDFPLPYTTEADGRWYVLKSKQVATLKMHIGKSYHRFIVLGREPFSDIIRNHKRNRVPKWVVKCVCGRYALRTTKALVNPKNKNDCCNRCREIAYLRKKDHYEKYGEEIPHNGRDI